MKKMTLCLLSILSFFSSQAQWTTQCGTGNDMVVSFAPDSNNIYATGFFTSICGTNANYISKWDGTQWSTLDTGLIDAGHRVEILNNDIYVAPYRQAQDSNWILKWDGAHFEKIGEGVYLTTVNPGTSKFPNLYDVTLYNGNLVASGEFDVVGDKQISGIMQWNGSSWDSLGAGLSSSLDGSGIMYPHQLLVFNNDLYVVGNFKFAGGVTVNGIAMWDGTQWHAMGAGFNKEVYGIGIFNNEIYVGGEFTASGSTTLQRVAKWDGTNWVNPGFGVYYTNSQLHAYVHTVQQIGTHLVLEGGFDHAIINGDTSIAHSVIAYDGTSVDTMDGGIATGEFEGIASYNSDVLVGGALFNGNSATTHIASYHFHSTGVSTLNQKSISIYPIPATDNITVENAQNNRLNIYDLTGRLVNSRVLDNNKESVSIQDLSPGIYMAQVIDNNTAPYYIKIVKE